MIQSEPFVKHVCLRSRPSSFVMPNQKIMVDIYLACVEKIVIISWKSISPPGENDVRVPAAISGRNIKEVEGLCRNWAKAKNGAIETTQMPKGLMRLHTTIISLHCGRDWMKMSSGKPLKGWNRFTVCWNITCPITALSTIVISDPTRVLKQVFLGASVFNFSKLSSQGRLVLYYTTR